MNYTPHEFANIFPMMTAEEHAGLVENIRQHGFDSSLPVILFQDKILDGRNRFKACNELGITPPFKQFEGDSQAALDYVMRTNLERRQLNSGQKAFVGLEYERCFAEVLKEKERERKTTVARLPQSTEIPTIAQRAFAAREIEEREREREYAIKMERRNNPEYGLKARDHAANAVGCGARYISDAKKIQAESPEIAEKVKSGKINMQEAKKELKAEMQEKKAAIEEIPERERRLIELVKEGFAVVANLENDAHLLSYARKNNLLVMIDRTSDWGNPFLLDKDGGRDEVISAYENHYLPHKPSLLKQIDSLKGKVLGCHCAPLPCHGDCLTRLVNG